jgi:hypothetical protein
MPDIEHKLHYRGVNWNKVHARQEKNWAAKASKVEIIKPADPEKLEEFKKVRQDQGLNVPKRKKGKKTPLTKAQRRARRLAKAKMEKSGPSVKSLQKNKAILEANPRVTAAGTSRPAYNQPMIGPDPFTKPPHVVNTNKKKKKKSPKQKYSSVGRKRSTGDESGGLPVVRKAAQ